MGNEPPSARQHCAQASAQNTTAAALPRKLAATLPARPMDYPGNLYAVAAPSGTGKSSLVKSLLELDSHLVRSIIAAGQFVEWAEVHGNLYGTSRGAIEARIVGGHDVMLEIDWQGALQIKKLFPNAVLIFLLPPSWDELLARLQRRGEDGPEVSERRMANARIEVSQARHFDFVIINAQFETALFDLKAIVHSQRLKYVALQRARPAVFAALDLL